MLASGKRRLCCFPGIKVVYEKKRKIMRNVASVAELTKSFFAEIDKVEDCTRTVHERVVFSLLGLAFEVRRDKPAWRCG
jgi:hypothetical protein